MRKTSHYTLDADSWFILNHPAPVRAIIIHSYSDCIIKSAMYMFNLEDHLLTTDQNNELSAGADWFELPKTALTPQIKRDFQLLEMRSVLDPHRHWKKDSRKGKVPTFSQVGTVIQGPTEWYSSRINKKDRAKNFVEETMATEKNSGRFKRKYDEIQAGKTSGKKAHYKSLMSKRKRTS